MSSVDLFLNQYVTTVVKSYRDVTSQIRLFELGDPEDWELPPFEAGAHIDIVMGPDLVRQYSLCGNPRERRRYYIAVQKEKEGRGGSLHIHSKFRVGSTVPVSLPRNLFPLEKSASHSILIAGGIGLTPFMSMLPVLLAEDRSFHLHVCTRTRASTPFIAQLDALKSQGLVTFHHSAAASRRRIDMNCILRNPVKGTHAYFCGSQGLLDSFIGATSRWPLEAVHYERFGAAPLGGPAYMLKLGLSQRTIEVAAGESMANALKRNGVKVRTSCESGICGMCKVEYISGDSDHRDHVLTHEERKKYLMPCVSSSNGKPLVLDV